MRVAEESRIAWEQQGLQVRVDVSCLIGRSTLIGVPDWKIPSDWEIPYDWGHFLSDREIPSDKEIVSDWGLPLSDWELPLIGRCPLIDI